MYTFPGGLQVKSTVEASQNPNSTAWVLREFKKIYSSEGLGSSQQLSKEEELRRVNNGHLDYTQDSKGSAAGHRQEVFYRDG